MLAHVSIIYKHKHRNL